MLGPARHKGERAVVGPLLAACGCSLLIVFSISAGAGEKRPVQGRQRARVHQDPAQQPAPTPPQQPPPETPPRATQANQPPPATPPAQAAPPTPAAKTPPAQGKRLTLRERAWLTLQDGVKENGADKRARAPNALGLLSASREAEGMAI